MLEAMGVSLVWAVECPCQYCSNTDTNTVQEGIIDGLPVSVGFGRSGGSASSGEPDGDIAGDEDIAGVPISIGYLFDGSREQRLLEMIIATGKTLSWAV